MSYNLIKDFAIYHDFDNLKHEKFMQVAFEDLKVGDIVKTITMTYSQKYILYEGYEEYNMEKIGILLEKNNNSNGSSRLYRYLYNEEDHFEETSLYTDPGTSGYFIIYKYL
jgi:hypothetical protein